MTVAEIEVVCPGMLEILSVGRGDIKLSIDNSNPEEVANAKRIIEEMLRAGYGIFVETDKGLTRVKKFNAKRMTYVISEMPEGAALPSGPGEKPTVQPVEREVPVAGPRAKAIGRTAGG